MTCGMSKQRTILCHKKAKNKQTSKQPTIDQPSTPNTNTHTYMHNASGCPPPRASQPSRFKMTLIIRHAAQQIAKSRLHQRGPQPQRPECPGQAGDLVGREEGEVACSHTLHEAGERRLRRLCQTVNSVGMRARLGPRGPCRPRRGPKSRAPTAAWRTAGGRHAERGRPRGAPDKPEARVGGA